MFASFYLQWPSELSGLRDVGWCKHWGRGGGFSSCGHWYMRQEMWHPGKGYCPGKLTFRERWLPRKGDFPGKGKGYCENFIANSKFEQKIGSMFFFFFMQNFAGLVKYGVHGVGFHKYNLVCFWLWSSVTVEMAQTGWNFGNLEHSCIVRVDKVWVLFIHVNKGKQLFTVWASFALVYIDKLGWSLATWCTPYYSKLTWFFHVNKGKYLLKVFACLGCLYLFKLTRWAETLATLSTC